MKLFLRTLAGFLVLACLGSVLAIGAGISEQSVAGALDETTTTTSSKATTTTAVLSCRRRICALHLELVVLHTIQFHTSGPRCHGLHANRQGILRLILMLCWRRRWPCIWDLQAGFQ
jgi:hypothetical protein